MVDQCGEYNETELPEVDPKKLIEGMIFHAIEDLKMKGVRHYDGLGYDYCAEEAMRWLRTWGVYYLMKMGFSYYGIMRGLDNPEELVIKLGHWKKVRRGGCEVRQKCDII